MNSGKSTLALSLLHLNELVSGRILIDGQDISLIPRSSIRHHISCLSQGPFIFPGSVRQNIGPRAMIPDAQIIQALQSVEVWNSLVAARHGQDGTGTDEDVLASRLDESSLSQGQKQLLCLARTLLKKSKILILDEPTSRYVCLFIYLAGSKWLTD